MCTLDNAKNNQRMMRELEFKLKALDIQFDREQNRVRYVDIEYFICYRNLLMSCKKYRCFPHVINIAVKAGLQKITAIPDDSLESREEDALFLQGVNEGVDLFEDLFAEPHTTASDQDLLTDAEYRDVLDQDPISKIRQLVNSVRVSGQRREQFTNILVAGNAAGGWDYNGTLKMLRDVGLIGDVDTRWGSTFSMVDRFVELYKVSYITILIPLKLTFFAGCRKAY